MSTTKSSSGSLRTYLITRLLLVIPMVWILVTLVFFVMRVIGDPIEAEFGGRLSAAADRRQAARGRAGPPSPARSTGSTSPGVLARQLRHGAHRPRGDQPRPRRQGRRDPGADLLGAARRARGRHPARPDRRPLPRPAPDVGLRLFAVLCYATPVFFFGLLLQLLFAIKLGWFFASGRASPDVEFAITGISAGHPHLHPRRDHPRQPARRHRTSCGTPSCPPLTLGLLVGGVFIRLVRVNLLQTLRSDYVEAARARGVPERQVMRKHAFRNALIPVVTVMGLQIAVAARRRGADRGDLRVEGPRLRARART